MAATKADILDAIANMTGLDLSELIKEMEEKLRLEQLQADDISIGAKVVGRVVDFVGEEKK